MSNVDDLRNRILEEAHGSRYSIDPSSTKMYHDLREVFWWDVLKRDIAEFVAMCPNCQQVKVEHLKPSILLQEYKFPVRNGKTLIWTSQWVCLEHDGKITIHGGCG